MFLEECRDPKACTILLRGGSKDFLNEVERNLQDAMQVARNVVFEPKLLPGGGAIEMALSVGASCSRVEEGVLCRVLASRPEHNQLLVVARGVLVARRVC
jgi:T-complex protein 1 subunit gamma